MLLVSLDLVFWRGADDRDPMAVCRALLDEVTVDDVERVCEKDVLDACRRWLVGWKQDRNMWTYQPDADGNGPAADLWIGPQVVMFSCYGLAGPQLNMIIDAMHSLHYPLFDPQIGERFTTPG